MSTAGGAGFGNDPSLGEAAASRAAEAQDTTQAGSNKVAAQQAESQETLAAHNQSAAASKNVKVPPKKEQKAVKTRNLKKVQKTQDSKEAKEEEAEKKANTYLGTQKNKLLSLKDNIHENATEEEILKAIDNFYEEQHELGDYALKFLEETADTPELKAKVTAARELYQAKHPGSTNRVLLKKGKAVFGDEEVMTSLTYKAINENQKFKELWDGWKTLEPQALAVLFDNIMHEVGVVTKVEGSEVDPPYLSALLLASRNVAAAQGVFRFMKTQGMPVFRNMLGSTMPKELNFVNISRLALEQMMQRTHSPTAIEQIFKPLGIQDYIDAKIVVTGRLIALAREVDRVRIFGDEIGQLPKGRDSFMGACKELLEDLEDEKEVMDTGQSTKGDPYGIEDFEGPMNQ